MLIFPEGTDYDKNTLERSDRYAAEHGLPKYTQVLHPRTTGFVYIFNLLNAQRMLNHIDDVTVAYDGGVIPKTEVDLPLGNLPANIHFYMDTYDSEKLAGGGDGGEDGADARDKRLEAWLKDRWCVKEAMLVSFYANKASARLDSANLNAENAFDRNYQALYETQHEPHLRSGMAYFYPAYWLGTMAIVCYLTYTYLLFKLYIMAAFLFFFGYCQLMGKHFDHWVVDSGLPVSVDSSVDTSKKTE